MLSVIRKHQELGLTSFALYYRSQALSKKTVDNMYNSGHLTDDIKKGIGYKSRTRVVRVNNYHGVEHNCG